MYHVKATNKKLIRHTQWDDKNKSINTWSIKNKNIQHSMCSN